MDTEFKTEAVRDEASEPEGNAENQSTRATTL